MTATNTMGFLFTLSGLGFLGFELHENVRIHPLHIGAWVGLAVLGAFLVNPTRAKEGIRNGIVPVLVLLPWTKARRESKAQPTQPES